LPIHFRYFQSARRRCWVEEFDGTGRAYIRLGATDLAVKFWWGAGRVERANISDISCSNLSVITYFDGKPTRWWQLNRHFHGGKAAITLYGMDVWI
jgi:hypothetical protein